MKFTIEKEILLNQFDDEIVLLNLKNGKYFSLNSTGVRVWELLQKHEDAEKVLTDMLDEYDIDKNVLRLDINNIILRLTAAELVIQA